MWNSLVARCPQQVQRSRGHQLRGRGDVQKSWCTRGESGTGSSQDCSLVDRWNIWISYPDFISFSQFHVQFSERFIVDCGHVALWRGGAGRALVCALGARAALILLFWSCTGGYCGWRCRGRASLFFKVCDNYCDIPHCDCQLLSSTSVHIFQSWPIKIKE